MSITLLTEAMSALLPLRLCGGHCVRQSPLCPLSGRPCARPRGGSHARGGDEPDNEQDRIRDDNGREAPAAVQISAARGADERSEELHAAVDPDRNALAVRR